MVGERLDSIRVDSFIWDVSPDGNVLHIQRHNVRPGDVEDVAANEPHYYLNLPGKSATHIMVGPNRTGRFLLVAMSRSGSETSWYVITAVWLERNRGARFYNRV